MIRFKKIILICFCFYLPFQSGGWALLGHRIVGEIAERHLTPFAKKEVIKILGTESLAMASNWADFIKSDSTYNYLYNWHFINIKGGLGHEEVMTLLKNDTAIDAYTRINFMVKELKKKSLPKDKKVFYLRLLIHIVGDIHQPLHVGRPEDLGGNRIRVTWFNAPYNIHQIWDSQLIDHQQLSYTEYATAINHSTPAQRRQWQKQPIPEWFWQAYQEAEKIYADIKPDEKLGYPYNYKFLGTLNNRLLMGGIHLAGLLNDIYKAK
jgi:hypothetical protein